MKTSSLDVNEKFQNENIKNISECDYIYFIELALDNLYMRLEKMDEIDFAFLHNRAGRGTGAGYKWDFRLFEMSEVKTREEWQIYFMKKWDE